MKQKGPLYTPMVGAIPSKGVPKVAPNTVGTTGVPVTQPAQIKFDGTARVVKK